MVSEHEGDGVGDELAPVIPLFGPRHGAHPERSVEARGRGISPVHGAPSGPAATRRFPVRRLPAHSGDSSQAGDSAHADAGRSRAPEDRAETSPDEPWHTTWRDLGAHDPVARPAPPLSTVDRGGVRFVELDDAGATAEPADGDRTVERAERKLVRALAGRGLSVSEARTKLRQQELAPHAIDEIIDRLERSGALDDERLAEQVAHTASTRRNQGRRAIAQSLAARGIARDVVERAIAELPDDDADRAYEFARSKARQLARYDEDTALRRLVGQLSRRGFGGGLAVAAARQALSEARGPAAGVRFE